MKRILIFSSLLLTLTVRPFSAQAADAPAAATPQAQSPERRGAAGGSGGLHEQRRARQRVQHQPGYQSRRPGPGHNAFQMVCAALVLFMTLPGLALFYGGLVRRKNVLSVLAQCLGIAGLVTILWWLCGYSLAFSKGGVINGVLGNLDWAFLAGVDSTPNTGLRRLGLAQRLFDVSAHVRHHHAGVDHWRHRRAHEVLRRSCSLWASGCSWSISRSRTWSGVRTA